MATKLQFVKFNDFRPGIITRSDRGLNNNAVPAPQGSAQYTNTYRCHALPSGGLAPLPKMIATWTGPLPDATGYAHGPYIVGMQSFGPIFFTGGSQYPDEVFVGVDWISASTGLRSFRVFRLRLYDNPYAVDTIIVINAALVNPVNQYWGMTFATSRMNNVDPLLPGVPVVAMEWSEPGPGFEKHVWTFPDPAAPGVSGVYQVSTTAGQILGHQGRLVQLEQINYSHGTTGGVPTNEQINFTDPPNSITLGTQNEIFSQENPVGYGAWGSISAGELVLIKNEGGAVIVSGDIAYPTITRLPGVVGTGRVMSKAAATPAGLFYYSNEGGVYVWRGSDTSQLVSQQLDPDAFVNNPAGSTTQDTPAAPILNTTMNFEAWHNWVLASNNWLFDTDANSWWQIENHLTRVIRYWSKASHPNLMYGAPVNYDLNAVLFTWDKTTPATSYSWQSQPLPVTQNRLINVREIVVIAQGTGTVTISLLKTDGSTQVETFNITSGQTREQMLRKRTEAKGYTITWRAQSDGGTGPAPVIHSVELGWDESQEATAA